MPIGRCLRRSPAASPPRRVAASPSSSGAGGSRMSAAGDGKAAWRRFRIFAIASGLIASVAFVVLGVAAELQLYGDGSIFSYAVAAQDAWAFHWHNISGRLFTYLFAYVVPQQIVALTGSARASIAAYGVLF